MRTIIDTAVTLLWNRFTVAAGFAYALYWCLWKLKASVNADFGSYVWW